MIKLLAGIFIKNKNDYKNEEVRRKYGILCGGFGIFLNILLFAGKFAAGIISNSVAMTADAVNNLSDAGSSAITMIGFKMAGQKPDPDHPFGHGRIEYISGLIVSMAIILMGFELLKSSAEKIFSPQETEFNLISAAILIAAIAVKLYMYLYNKAISKKINSAAMKAAAEDSISDCLATTAVLVSVLILKFFGINIDGWCGVAVACFIMITGFKSAKETVSPLLGQKPDEEFVKKIKETVLRNEEILGIHDLIVHDYGPGRIMVSLHAEVSANADILKIHDTIDNIEKELAKELNCHTVIHMDPISADDEETVRLKNEMIKIITEENEKYTLHDFRIVKGDTHTNIIFDLVVPFEVKEENEKIKEKIDRKVKRLNPSYFTVIDIDRDFT